MKLRFLFLVFYLLVNPIFSNGTSSLDNNSVLNYSDYFNRLTPEEQVIEFVNSFSDVYPIVEPPDFIVAWNTFTYVTGLKAMPYLKREFHNLNFEYKPGQFWTDLANETPQHILNLISNMVWLNKFPKNHGKILKPSDDDVQWFIKETQIKIERYIKDYKRIDNSMISAELAIIDMSLDTETANCFHDKSISFMTKYLFQKYVNGKDFENEVGIPADNIFEGYSGPLL